MMLDEETKKRLHAFAHERDEAFIDVVKNDKLDKFKAFIKKWFGDEYPYYDDIMLKVSVYKSVAGCTKIPQDVKDEAREKCIALGCKPYIDWSDVS